MRKIAILLTCLTCTFFANSQDFSNKGKDFWVGYGYHQQMSQGNSQEMVLYFATDQVTNITITIPGTGYTQSLTSAAGNNVLTSAPIPKVGAQDARLLAESLAPENKGIHIVADRPIVAYAHIYNQSVSGACILFPTTTLGKEYYSINFKNISNTDAANCWFYVLATDTGITTVEITPSASTINHVAGVPFTVTLTQGQIYNIMGTLTGNTAGVFNGVDLTGSKIKSITTGTRGCKKIAVFSGSGRIAISCNGTAPSSDNYMVQAFPKTAWGKKFLTAHTGGLINDYYRICVSDPAAVVTVNGAPIAVPLINNFYYELAATSAELKIESDLPITVAQYITSQGACGNGTPGDPEVIYLSSVEQNIAKVQWNATPNFAILDHYFNVVIPNTGTALSSFRLLNAAGTPVATNPFTVHPQDPNYSYLIQQLPGSGVYSIQSDSGFNAIAYGFGNAESYGYNAGTNIRDLYNFIRPINPYSIVPDPVACTGTPFYISVTFPFQPTSLYWDFHGFPIPAANVTIPDPTTIFSSTYFIGGKQVWEYKLPSLYTYSPANSTPGYPITITAGTTTSEGCGNSFERDFTLAIYDPPVADYTYTNNGCVNDTVRFTDNTTYLAGTYSYKWYWNFGDGHIDSVRNPKHLFSAPGTYTVKFAMISNVGCLSDTATKIITVTGIPTPVFGISSPRCAGAPITFSDTSVVATPATVATWYWDYGDGILDTLHVGGNHPHTYGNWGNQIVTLHVASNSGCMSPTINHPIYVGPIPFVDYQMPGGLCLPSDTAHFVNLSTMADGSLASVAYLWNFGDPPSGANNTSVLTNPVHFYNHAAAYSINLQVTSNVGCVHDTTKVLSTVYDRPLSAFTVLPENCLNTATSFTSQSSGSGHPIAEWHWDFGDASTGTGVTVTHTYATPGIKIVKHWIKTDVGCYSDTTTHQVLINPLPTATFTYSSPSCTNRTISFIDGSTPNAGVLTEWHWNFADAGSGSLNTSTLQSPSHTFSASGVYAVQLYVKTDKGCQSAPTTVINVTVNPRPHAGFISPEICLNDSAAVFIDTSSVAGGTIAGWDWNFGDPGSPFNTSTLQNPSHKYTSIGTKNCVLIVTSNSGCKDTLYQSFYVNGNSPVSNFVVQNPGSLCANDTVRIKNTSTIDLGSIVKIEIAWDNINAPGVFDTDDYPYTDKIYAHKYPDFQSPLTKTYQIRLRAYSGITCLSDKLINITLNASSKVQFSPIPNTCLYVAPFQITQAVEIGGVPGIPPVYSGPGVSPTGIFNPLAVGPGVYTIHYLYTSLAGCLDSATQQIRVLAPPVAKFGFGNPACETQTLLFTDSSVAPVGTITSWVWDFGDGTVPEIHTNNLPFTHVFAHWGTYHVKLIVTTDYGCNSLVKDIAVLVSPMPKPNFDYPDTLCLPFVHVRFRNLSTIEDHSENNFVYYWNFGDPASGALNSSNDLNPEHVYSTTGPFTVLLRVMSGAGCVRDTTITITTIHPQPKADFSFDRPSVCIGETVQLRDLSNGRGSAVNAWHWTFGDNTGSTEQNPYHTYATTGIYMDSLYVMNAFGCYSDTAVKTYGVYPYPTADAGPDQLVLEGSSVALQANATGNQLSYLWTPDIYLNNNHLLSPVTTPLNHVTYSLTVTGEGGCMATDQVYVKVLFAPKIPNTFTPNNDGINDFWDIQYLKTYPNNRVQVFTRTGQLVFESRGYQTPWNGTLNGKPLPFDTYYYIIEIGNGREPVTGYVTIVK